jgi:hypothetical protein
MKIQHIESTYNINHKAKFIDDNQGYFRNLWKDSVLDMELADMIDNFAKNNKKHSLEITDVFYNEKKKFTSYSIFNHYNGFGLTVESSNSPGFVLHEILEKITKSQLLTNKNSRTATLFKKLTGQYRKML